MKRFKKIISICLALIFFIALESDYLIANAETSIEENKIEEKVDIPLTTEIDENINTTISNDSRDLIQGNELNNEDSILQETEQLLVNETEQYEENNEDEDVLEPVKNEVYTKESYNEFEFDSKYGAITKYTGTSSNLTIPNTINGVVVTKIGSYAFKDNINLKSVSVPSTVKSIEVGAFLNCSNLETVTLKDGLELIGSTGSYTEGAFQNCGSLKSIIIPKTVTRIGRNSFFGCSELETVHIKGGDIYSDAFKGNRSITKLTLDEGVRSIGSYAFYECTGIKSITIPSTVTIIENNAFEKNSNLETIIFKEGLTKIYSKAFKDNISLKSVSIPSTVKSIGDGAFLNCSKLETVTLKDGLEFIGDTSSNYSGAFENCRSLKSITIPKTVSRIGANSFRDCTNILEARILAADAKIYQYAFYNCTSLTNLTLSKWFAKASNIFTNTKKLRLVRVYKSATTNELATVKEQIKLSGANVDSVEFVAMNSDTDVNKDGVVDILDVSLVANSYNSKKGNSKFKNILDINGDDLIDLYDLSRVSMSF